MSLCNASYDNVPWSLKHKLDFTGTVEKLIEKGITVVVGTQCPYEDSKIDVCETGAFEIHFPYGKEHGHKTGGSTHNVTDGLRCKNPVCSHVKQIR